MGRRKWIIILGVAAAAMMAVAFCAGCSAEQEELEIVPGQRGLSLPIGEIHADRLSLDTAYFSRYEELVKEIVLKQAEKADGEDAAQDAQGGEAEKPFDSSASEELEGKLDELKPAVVHLYHATTEMSVAGSGFLMEITEDAVYIVTNNHVIKDFDDWDVTFADGTKAVGEKVGVSDEFDVGVVKVQRGDIPDSLAQQLMTVRIDLDDWVNRLFGIRFPVGYITIDGSGEVRSKVTGNVIRTLAVFSRGNGNQQTLLDFPLTPGDSGSAIIDARGNLVSMVLGVSHESDQSTKYWGVPLDAIVMCYEQITGRSLF